MAGGGGGVQWKGTVHTRANISSSDWRRTVWRRSEGKLQNVEMSRRVTIGSKNITHVFQTGSKKCISISLWDLQARCFWDPLGVSHVVPRTSPVAILGHWPFSSDPFPLMHSGNASYCIPPKSQHGAPLTTAPAWLCKSLDATIRAHSWLFSWHRQVPDPFWGVTNIDVSGDSRSQLFKDSIILKTKLHLLVLAGLVLSVPLLRKGF